MQLPLQLFQLPCPLVDLAHAHGKALLLLDDGAGLGLGQCIQLLHISKGPLGVGVALGDGLHLHVEAMLPCPCRCPPRDRHPHEHAGPQLEAPTLISKVLTFTA
jgi:hypothetical protein